MGRMRGVSGVGVRTHGLVVVAVLQRADRIRICGVGRVGRVATAGGPSMRRRRVTVARGGVVRLGGRSLCFMRCSEGMARCWRSYGGWRVGGVLRVGRVSVIMLRLMRRRSGPGTARRDRRRNGLRVFERLHVHRVITKGSSRARLSVIMAVRVAACHWLTWMRRLRGHFGR